MSALAGNGRRRSQLTREREEDLSAVGLCQRCGLRSEHGSAAECSIEELRDRIGTLELTVTGLRGQAVQRRLEMR